MSDKMQIIVALSDAAELMGAQFIIRAFHEHTDGHAATLQTEYHKIHVYLFHDAVRVHWNGEIVKYADADADAIAADVTAKMRTHAANKFYFDFMRALRDVRRHSMRRINESSINADWYMSCNDNGTAAVVRRRDGYVAKTFLVYSDDAAQKAFAVIDANMRLKVF